MTAARFLVGPMLLAWAATATATVLVPMSDDAMMARADDVVTGIVERVDGVETAVGAIETWATVRIVDVLKGHRSGERLVLRQPGGVVGDLAVTVYGTAALEAGDAILVLGQRATGGGIRPVGMALGVYRLSIEATGAAVADRAIGDRRSLASLLSSLASGGDAVARRLVIVPESVSASFTFLGVPPGRWFELDRGLTVAIRSANGDADLGRARSDALLRRGFDAWTNVPNATARLALGPDAPTGPSVASGVCDGKSVAQFNDPADEIGDLSGCAGVLAIGGYCSRTTAIGPGGGTYRVITEGDLTVNRRIAACFSETNVTEVVTHELGHVLGLGHSSENVSESIAELRDATMFFLAHFDGRGAMVRADDMAGLRVLYPADDDDDGIPNEFDLCPATPAGHPADETGCACDDAGHAACPPGDLCTVSRCAFETAACITEPVDCTGGEPCLTGSCTQGAGCAPVPVDGYDAIACGLARNFAPGPCDDDRIPRAFRRLIRRAQALVTNARFTSPERQDVKLARAVRKLDRAARRLERASAVTRRHPLSSGCTQALTLLVEDARLRVQSRGTSVVFDPTPNP